MAAGSTVPLMTPLVGRETKGGRQRGDKGGRQRGRGTKGGGQRGRSSLMTGDKGPGSEGRSYGGRRRWRGRVVPRGGPRCWRGRSLFCLWGQTGRRAR